MGKKTDLSNDEKCKIIKLLSDNFNILSISRIIKRDKRTIKNFVENPLQKRKERVDKGKFRKIDKHDLRKIKKNVKNKPLKTSATIFNEVLASDTPKTTRCRILKSISDVKSPVKKPVLTQRHRELRLEWARTYFQQNFLGFCSVMKPEHPLTALIIGKRDGSLKKTKDQSKISVKNREGAL